VGVGSWTYFADGNMGAGSWIYFAQCNMEAGSWTYFAEGNMGAGSWTYFAQGKMRVCIILNFTNLKFLNHLTNELIGFNSFFQEQQQFTSRGEP